MAPSTTRWTIPRQPAGSTSVQVAGSLGTIPADDLFEASGTIGTVTVAGANAKTLPAPPLIWAEAAIGRHSSRRDADRGQRDGHSNSDIWIAVFGQEIATPGPGQMPPVGKSYYLNAADVSTTGSPDAQSTSTLYALPSTPDQPTLPSSTLAQWGNNLALPVPAPGQQFTGRSSISVGAPVQAQVNLTNGTVSAPNPASAIRSEQRDILRLLGVYRYEQRGRAESGYRYFAGRFVRHAVCNCSSSRTRPARQTYNYAITGNTTLGSETITNIPNTSQLSKGIRWWDRHSDRRDDSIDRQFDGDFAGFGHAQHAGHENRQQRFADGRRGPGRWACRPSARRSWTGRATTI